MLAASPAFKRLSSVEDCTFAGPTLKVQDTRAPYWFAFRTTAEEVRRVIVCWGDLLLGLAKVQCDKIMYYSGGEMRGGMRYLQVAGEELGCGGCG